MQAAEYRNSNEAIAIKWRAYVSNMSLMDAWSMNLGPDEHIGELKRRKRSLFATMECL